MWQSEPKSSARGLPPTAVRQNTRRCEAACNRRRTCSQRPRSSSPTSRRVRTVSEILSDRMLSSPLAVKRFSLSCETSEGRKQRAQHLNDVKQHNLPPSLEDEKEEGGNNVCGKQGTSLHQAPTHHLQGNSTHVDELLAEIARLRADNDEKALQLETLRASNERLHAENKKLMSGGSSDVGSDGGP